MPSKFFDRYSTDKVAEEEGQWVDFGDGIKVQLRRLNCKKSRDVRRRLEKPYAKQFRGQDIPDEIQERMLNAQLAKAVIVGWEGVPNPDNRDTELPCTEDNVLMMMQRYPDFRDEILTASMERATYQQEEQKEEEGNLQSSSAGS